MLPPLTVAAAQPLCHAKAVLANALEHARLIRTADARLVVFHELSLTGYELDAEAVSTGGEALIPIVKPVRRQGAVALVGAPAEDEAGDIHIAMLLVAGGATEISYRKSYLGGTSTAVCGGQRCSNSTGGGSGSASAKTQGSSSTSQTPPHWTSTAT